MDRILFPLAPILDFLGAQGFIFCALLAVLLTLYLLAPRMVFLERAERVDRKRRGEQGRNRETQRASLERNKVIAAQEFVDATGVTRGRYLRLAFLIAFAIAALSFAVFQSPILSFLAAVSFFSFRTAQAAGRMQRLRAGLLTNEVLPMSRAISQSLATGQSLPQALAEATRGERGETSLLKTAVRRALADARGLEEGLRDEESRDIQDPIKEFFEILADGASVARSQATTAETLEKFAEINQRQKAQYQLALRATGQARGTRTMLVAIPPLVMAGSLLVSGPDLMLHTVGGQIIIGMVFVMVWLATSLSNRIISSVTKGF